MTKSAGQGKYKGLRELVAVWRECRGYRATARRLGLSDHGSIKRRLERAVKLGLLGEDEIVSLKDNKVAKGKEGFEERIGAEYQDDRVYLNSVSTRIKTQEDLMEYYGLDPDDWDIVKIKVGNWEVSMKLSQGEGKPDKATKVPAFRIELSLHRKTPHPLEIAIRGLVDDMPILPTIQPSKQVKKKDIAAELAPVDIHFGKFAWHPETMGGNMDSKIASKVFIDSCSDNLEKLAKWPLAKIYLVIGNDLMHFENIWAHTPRGHHQLDVDSRLPKVIEVCKRSVIHVVDLAVQIAPVEIIRIPGNHDIHASYWLCEILKERYRNSKHVVIDNGPSDRKCRLWGDLLVGWTHDASGRKQMPTVNMLPQFWPKEWGQSRFREWHVGHKHKADVTKTKPVCSVGGTVVRQLSCLTTIDRWHFDEVFVDAVPACESFVWDKKMGIRAAYPSFIDYLQFKKEAA
jgi:hypothetical protein